MTIDENVPLKSLNTLKVGGEARYFCVVKNLEDIKEAAVFGKRAGVPILVLGGGSNVLISDQGFSGLVVKMAMRGMKFDEKKGHTNIDVAAGENWDNFVEEVVSEKLWGLENLSGIPGTVGASPVQNIGAYGTEFPSLDKFGTAGSFFKNPVISEKLFEKLKEQFPGIPGFPSGDGSFKLSLAWILDNLLNL